MIICHWNRYIVIYSLNTIDLYYIFWALIKKKGKKVATTKDKNNKDWDMNGDKVSTGIIIPKSKLFEKSGAGKIKKPPIKPITIEV